MMILCRKVGFAAVLVCWERELASSYKHAQSVLLLIYLFSPILSHSLWMMRS